MLARRIIAVSPDKAFGKQLAVALKAAGGAVDLHHALDELGTGELAAALVVVHLDGELAAEAPGVVARLTGETRMIAILPRSNLAAVVDIMQSSDRVAAMMVADDFDPRALSALATRVLAGDIFGLDKVTPWGTQIHSYMVGDYQEKSLCIAQVSEFAELMGVRRKYRESIEQCLDEMLMNALYDAPVDEQGRQIFSEIPTKTRISLRVEQKVVVQYACDGKQFAMAVRDVFGTLERATVFRYLHKCLHNEQQIDRKAGGAGLGLYLMTNSSTNLFFNVLPGVATEAVCTFDLEAPKVQLECLGYFTEKIDASGRLASGPPRRLPAGTTHPVERRAAPERAQLPRGIVIGLVAAIVVTLGLVAIAAWPRLFGPRRASIAVRTIPPDATIELAGRAAGTAANGELVIGNLEVGRAYPIVARHDGYEPTQAVVEAREGDANAITLELVALPATVVLDSRPSGATVALDGNPAGATPLTVTTLAPGATVAVAFKKPGYLDVATQLVVPRPGTETRLILPLAAAPDVARIRLVSEPPGAQVIENGQLLVGVTTPAEVLVEAGKQVRFVLAMPHKVSAVIEPFTPTAGGGELVRTGKLIDGTDVRVSANLAGTATITRAAHCVAEPLPLVCTLAPGSYTIELAVPQGAKIARAIKVGDKPLEAKFELGYVEAGAGKHLQLPSGPVRKAVFEAGSRRVVVTNGDGPHTATVNVKVGATVVAQ